MTDSVPKSLLDDLRAGLFPVVAVARAGLEWNDYAALLQRSRAAARAVARAEADCETTLHAIIQCAAEGKRLPAPPPPPPRDPMDDRPFVEDPGIEPSKNMVDAAKWLLAKRFPERWGERFEVIAPPEPRAYSDLVEDLRKYAAGVAAKREEASLEGAARH